MDTLGLQILRSELLADAGVLTAAAGNATKRFAETHPGHLEATAYELHRFYNVLEKSFERICASFENHFPKQGDYHDRSIERMLLALPEIRPAFLTPDLKLPLRELKGFRHLFRHAYDLELQADRLAPLVAKATQVAEWFPLRVEAFSEDVEAS